MIGVGPQAEKRTTKSEWRAARRAYAIYSNVIAHFDVGVPPCPELEAPVDRADFAARGRVRNWLNTMDSQCPVAYLRQVLQRDAIGTEANLRTLIRRHLDRPHKTELDRDKVDFLLVQYFAHCVASDVSPSELTMAQVGKVLEPVLGSWSHAHPYWLKSLDMLAADVAKCHRMQDLHDLKILERGREIKSSAGERFFEPPALIAFTRYNIILRRAFFYTMRADLEAVRLNVARLEGIGVKSIDATSAGLSEREALSSVSRICTEWRSIFRADYSSGHVFRSINELRACTDEAVAEAFGDGSGAAANDEELTRALTVLQEEETPISTVESVYPELMVESDPVAGTPARHLLPEVLRSVREQVSRANEDGRKTVTVQLEGSSIRLALWEKKAFLPQEHEFADAIRRSVAARLILQEAFDDLQEGDESGVQVALTIAHGEAGRMQEKIAEARDQRNADMVVALTATAQRLLELMHEAEFAWEEEN